MCSNAAPGSAPRSSRNDLADRLGAAIEELAAEAGSGRQPPDQDIAARLAAAWALVAEADPELAERTAGYAR